MATAGLELGGCAVEDAFVTFAITASCRPNCKVWTLETPCNELISTYDLSRISREITNSQDDPYVLVFFYFGGFNRLLDSDNNLNEGDHIPKKKKIEANI